MRHRSPSDEVGSGVSNDLVESGQDPFQLGAVKEVLELGHNAVQQHLWLGCHHTFSSNDGVGCNAPVYCNGFSVARQSVVSWLQLSCFSFILTNTAETLNRIRH